MRRRNEWEEEKDEGGGAEVKEEALKEGENKEIGEEEDVEEE